MDFDFLSSNLQLAYPFHEKYTVDWAGISVPITDLYAGAVIRENSRTAERLGLVSLLVRADGTLAPGGSSSSSPSSSSSSGTPYLNARLVLRWEESEDEIVLDQNDVDVEFQWIYYGAWGVASWYRQLDVFARFIVPLSAITDDGGGNEMIVTGYDGALIAQSADNYLLQQGVVAGGPGKLQRVFWKQGDQVQLVADRGEELVLQAGFNMQLGEAEEADDTVYEAEEFTLSEGRPLTQLAIDAVPGAGMGKYLLCPGSQYLLTLNGAGPNAQGDVKLKPVDCYWLERPLAGPIIGKVPEHGISGTAEMQPNAVGVRNACLPCCSCADYISTYLHMKEIWDRGKAVSERIYGLRGQVIALSTEYDLLMSDGADPITLTIREPTDLLIQLAHLNTTPNEVTAEMIWTISIDGPGGMTESFTAASGIAKAGAAIELVDPSVVSGDYVVATTLDVPPNTWIFWSGLWTLGGVDGETVTVSLSVTGGASFGGAQTIDFPPAP